MGGGSVICLLVEAFTREITKKKNRFSEVHSGAFRALFVRFITII